MRRFFCFVAAGLATVAPAQAQLVSAAAPQSMVEALQQGGYKAQLVKDKGGDPQINSAVGGTNFTIFFYGCTKNEACKTVQFFAGFTGDAKVTLEQLNKWNADFRWARAYRADSGDLRLEMDVDLEDGGMSRALFLDNIEYWEATLAAFEKHIGRG